MKIIGINPTKKFYFGCVVISLIGISFGIFSNRIMLGGLFSFMGLTFFIDLELIDLIVKRKLNDSRNKENTK